MKNCAKALLKHSLIHKLLKRKLLSSGFTLIEVMITIAILAILVSVAAPDFSRFIQQVKLDRGVDKIAKSIAFARNSALTLNDSNHSIIICPADYSTPNNPVCAANNALESGWLIFKNRDNNNTFTCPDTNNECVSTANNVDTLLERQPAINDLVINLTDSSNTALNFLKVSRSGTYATDGKIAVGESRTGTVVNNKHATVSVNLFGRLETAYEY